MCKAHNINMLITLIFFYYYLNHYKSYDLDKIKLLEIILQGQFCFKMYTNTENQFINMCVNKNNEIINSQF